MLGLWCQIIGIYCLKTLLYSCNNGYKSVYPYFMFHFFAFMLILDKDNEKVVISYFLKHITWFIYVKIASAIHEIAHFRLHSNALSNPNPKYVVVDSE